jgi:hypothetical protein
MMHPLTIELCRAAPPFRRGEDCPGRRGNHPNSPEPGRRFCRGFPIPACRRLTSWPSSCSEAPRPELHHRHPLAHRPGRPSEGTAP